MGGADKRIALTDPSLRLTDSSTQQIKNHKGNTMQIEPKTLDAINTALKTVILAKNTLEILNNVRISSQDDEFIAYVDNNDSQLTVTKFLEHDDSRENLPETLIDFKTLDKITKKASKTGNMLQISQNAQNSCNVNYGPNKFTLAMGAREHMPSYNNVQYSNQCTMPIIDFYKALERVSGAISHDETRYYLNGIYMHVNDEGKLVFVATDGHRLYKQSFDKNEAISPSFQGQIISKESVKALLKLLKGVKEGNIYWSQDDSEGLNLRFTWQNEGLFLRYNTLSIDGTFPDYERVIPHKPTAISVFNSKPTLECLDNCLMVSEKNRGTARFTFTSDGFRISADHGINHDKNANFTRLIEHDYRYTESELESGFETKYMIDLLNKAKTDDWEFNQNTPNDPCVLSTDSLANFIAVIMPKRLG